MLLTLSGFSPYTEFHVFDPVARRATRRPIGWDLSLYMPGRITPADGWDDSGLAGQASTGRVGPAGAGRFEAAA